MDASFSFPSVASKMPRNFSRNLFWTTSLLAFPSSVPITAIRLFSRYQPMMSVSRVASDNDLASACTIRSLPEISSIIFCTSTKISTNRFCARSARRRSRYSMETNASSFSNIRGGVLPIWVTDKWVRPSSLGLSFSRRANASIGLICLAPIPIRLSLKSHGDADRAKYPLSRAVPRLFLHNGEPRCFDFHCYGSLQERHRENYPVIALHIDQNSFEAAQCPVIHADALADFQVRPGLLGHSGRHCKLQRLNLFVRNRDGRASIPDNLQHAGSRDNRTAVLKIKSAKEIAREEWLFDLFYPVRPLPDALVRRQQALVTLSLDLRGHVSFLARADLEGIPRCLGDRTVCRAFPYFVQFSVRFPSELPGSVGYRRYSPSGLSPP